MENSDNIYNWPVAATVIGAIIALLSFLKDVYLARRENSNEKTNYDNNVNSSTEKELMELQKKIVLLNATAEEQARIIQEHKERLGKFIDVYEKNVDRTDSKIERLSEFLMDILHSRKS